MLENGVLANPTFQGAKVRKPLLAVSSVADKGNPTWFDSEANGGAVIIPGNAPELREIRRLISRVSNRIRLNRRGGTYQLRNWTLDKKASQGFRRPGA